jgi:MFS family permease
MLTKRVSANERGGILGISAALISGANALAPLMGGILFQVNSGLPFIVWGAIMAVLFGLAWTLLKPETSQDGGVRQAAPTAEQE